MKGALIAIAAAAVLASSGACGADSKGNYLNVGLGFESCSGIIKESKSKVGTLPMLNYVGGFLTAANIFTKNATDIADGKKADEITSIVLKYCRAHPQESGSEAIIKVLADINMGRMEE